MKNKLLFVLFLAAISLSAQSITPSNYVPPQLPPVFSGGDIGNAAAMMNNIGTAVGARDTLLYRHDLDINTLQAAVGAPKVGLSDRVAALEAQVKLLTGMPPAQAQVYGLAFSTSSARSPAASLNGAKITGSIYIFTFRLTDTLFNPTPTGIAQVCYLRDGTALRTDCEATAPYDFMSGTPPAAWNSASVSNGPHTITQIVTLTSGAIETDAATFSVAN